MPDDRPGHRPTTAADALGRDATTEAAWRTVMDTVMAQGGAISHHHGIGINRSSFMAPALGGSLDVLVAIKDALDPGGILNPGKLGLPSPFGELGWP